MEGCSSDNGDKKKYILNITILDCYDTTQQKLKREKHNAKYGECPECKIAMKLVSHWIAQLDSMLGSTGLNSREESYKS